MKLHEFRKNLGVTQDNIAKLLGISQAQVHKFEWGQALPCLEDHFALQANFLNRLEWPEKFKPGEKRQLIQAFIVLAEKLPLEMVTEFFARVIRRFPAEKAKNLILHYAELVENEEKILINS